MEGRDWGFVAVIVALSVFFCFLFLFFRFGRVSGTSMYPSLKDGDFIVLRARGTITVGRGDVIGYDPGPFAGLVAHRVVAAFPGYFFTQGDNRVANPWVDPVIYDFQIVGKAICRFRFPFLT